MRGDGGQAFAESGVNQTEFFSKRQEARRQERLRNGLPADRFEPVPVTRPSVAQECTDPGCPREVLRDGWCSRHLTAMAGGAR